MATVPTLLPAERMALMVPTQMPDGATLRGNKWSVEVTLPSHRTNADGTQGASMAWSGSTFTVDTNLPTSVPIVLTPALSATPPTVTLSLDEAATAAIIAQSFRWYLREAPNFGGDAFLWQRVKVHKE